MTYLLKLNTNVTIVWLNFVCITGKTYNELETLRELRKCVSKQNVVFNVYLMLRLAKISVPYIHTLNSNINYRFVFAKLNPVLNSSVSDG